MKFIHYLENISGVSIYPLTSLLIFFVFFIVLLWFVFRTNKDYLKKIEQLPLDNNNQ
ncbi:MAG TPA: CcoQ/FixQ family Cbb3-type cytochrome c oxidase assembly chaperone [Bacteroidia bacterium]